ncbi:MAG: TIGR02301 family protein [Rhodoplanes sp.]|nr:TIGR02301 family protein [Rhodoplanes sp.]
MKRAALSACLCLALLGSLGGPAAGQTTPFDNDLRRLAEILGALHYLRALCGANEGQKWRNEMQALVDAEAPSGARRSQMILAFNRGFNVFQQSYRTCTPPAEVAIRRYLEEGAKISREVTARYAN